ncbi:hypothetical protein R3P38DRAFT_3220694 [Favolaschia claudopus]|uniref:Uncharacterized protein n=1 Tax=Favolaschia claudopus TaxID=2862362 RepID=A0AAW0A282_9AGAR
MLSKPLPMLPLTDDAGLLLDLPDGFFDHRAPFLAQLEDQTRPDSPNILGEINGDIECSRLVAEPRSTAAKKRKHRREGILQRDLKDLASSTAI